MKKEKKDMLLRSVLLVLALSAVFLGVLIYKKNTVSVVKDQALDSNTPAKIDGSTFSEDERKLLMPPGSDASKEEKDEHSKLAAKLSVVGNSVELRDCKPDLLVLQTKVNSPVTLKNSGDYDISVSFDSENVLNIGVGKSVRTSEVFIHGPGLYGYLCKGNNFTGLTGFILLTP